MNVPKIMNRAVALFPNLNVKEGDSESQRRRLILDFYNYYLLEFGVDVDSVTKVQINQPEISAGNDMMAVINLKCTCDAIVPNNYLGLFDLISPSPSVLWSKIDLALDFYDFGDEVTNKIYDLCNPLMEAKAKIKQHEKTKIDKKNQIVERKLKKNHTTKLIEEAHTQIRYTDNLIEDVATERRLLESQIQQVIARKTMLTRQKNRNASSLEEMKHKMSVRQKVLLDHSVNCGSEISKLEEEVTQITEEKEKCIAKKEEMERDHNEINKLKDVLAQRLSTTSKIFDVITKYNDLKVRDQDRKTSYMAQSDCDDLINQISNQIQETEKLKKIKNRELTAIESKKNNIYFGTNVKRLQELQKQFLDVQSVKIKLDGLDSKAKKITEEYKVELEKLRAKEEKLINNLKNILNQNEQFFSQYEDKLKKIKRE